MDVKSKALAGLQGAVLAGVIAYRAAAGHQHVLWFSLVIFGIAVIGAESLGDRGERGAITTYGLIPMMGAIVALNGLTAVLVALCGALSLRPGSNSNPWRMAMNGLQYAVSVAASSFVYYALGGGGFVSAGSGNVYDLGQAARSIPALLVAALVFYMVNSIQVAILTNLEKGQPVQSFYSPANLLKAVNQLVYALVGLVAGIIYAQNAFHLDPETGLVMGSWGEAVRGFFALAAFLLLLGVAWYFSGRNLVLRRAYDQGVAALVRYTEKREPYLDGHAERVASLAAMTAKHLKLNSYEVNRLYYAALLHDIGKTSVPMQVLGKRGQLTEEEFDLVKKHPLESGQRIEDIDFLADLAEAVTHHHEQYDGGGYIDGLAGDTIPLAARIIAVADAYDAMVSERPWRGAKSHEGAVAELQQNVGINYDEQVTAAFLRALEEVRSQAEAVPEYPGEELPEEEIPLVGARLKERADSMRSARLSKRESKTERRRRELQERRHLRERVERQALEGEPEEWAGPPEPSPEAERPQAEDSQPPVTPPSEAGPAMPPERPFGGEEDEDGR